MIHIARDRFPAKHILQKININRNLSTDSYQGGVGVSRIEVGLHILQRNITDQVRMSMFSNQINGNAHFSTILTIASYRNYLDNTP